ncbi:MAG TPA: hypothetical protein PKM65_10680 [Spirochaetota bacterium]|nr:hypothetical protein [Spirochaetota bacterium]HNT09263.1 hypothetical protein [Spirochaetota bacterium]
MLLPRIVPRARAAMFLAGALALSCNAVKKEPAVVVPVYPEKLAITKAESLRTGIGAKSVEMSPDGSRVYSMNLEECSVYEYNRASRVIQRKLIFVMTPGKGWDYDKKVPINSYQEKPVEGHFSHNGRYLWVSLHNADGVAVWDLLGGDTAVEGKPFKTAWLHERIPPKPADVSAPPAAKKKAAPEPEFTNKKMKLLLIKTGATPKVIWSSPNGKYLFVSNWHSSTVSVIDISTPTPDGWNVVKTLRTGSVPRGMTASADSKFLYIAQMGGNFLSVVDLDTVEKVREITVGPAPRHILISNGYLYASICNEAKLIKVELPSGRIVQWARTMSSPRTIAASPDGTVIFVTCYNDNTVQAFRADTLALLATRESPGRPVGITVWQGGGVYEAWICNHTNFVMNVFTYTPPPAGSGTPPRQ